jgi:protein-S-isoprenylcysteine O-methyltransferase Ste14
MADDKRGRARGIVVPPPLIYLGPLVLGLLLGRAIPLPFLPRGLSRAFGWPLLGGGALLLWWFGSTLRSAETTIRIDRPVSRLVTRGPFRHSRNPGYLSFALFYAGVATLGRSPWAILFLPAALATVQRTIIAKEERYLERRFGEEYLRYKARMPRWL